MPFPVLPSGDISTGYHYSKIKKLAKIYYLTVTEEATRKLTVSARDELRIQLQRIL